MIDNLEILKLAQEGDTKAKDLLVEENSGLIWSIVRKFAGRGVEMEDLFQIGAIGLIKCINKFDMSYNVKFSTYAVPMIIGEIRRFLRDDGMIKVSRSLKELSVKAKYTKEAIYAKTGEYPTISELAKALGTEVEELIPALEATKDVDSIYSVTNRKDGSETYLLDKLSENKTNDDFEEDRITLKSIIDRLEERDKKIITLRYYDDRTQVEIAKELGISQVQVSRIEKKILLQMREQLK